MGWALYALYLFFFGLAVRERRQRWCGLVILACAMVRVCLSDIWGFSNGYKVLTFVVLTLLTPSASATSTPASPSASNPGFSGYPFIPSLRGPML